MKNLILALIFCCGFNLPDLGNQSRNVIGRETEELIASTMIYNLRQSGNLFDDLLTKDYITQIGNNLAAYADLDYVKYQFFVIDDNNFNAFAFLGGLIGINTGTIMQTETESEIAAVMAHEISHVNQQHILRIIARQKSLAQLTFLEAIAAVAVGIPDLIFPAIAGHAQLVVNFTREYEQEADRFGMQLLAKAGYDPQAMPNIFERMGKISRFNQQAIEYLQTHPLYESRISDARNRAQQLSYTQHPENLTFHLVKARIAVHNAADIKETINSFKQKLSEQRVANQVAANYALGLALIKDKEYKAGLDKLDNLSQSHPENLIIQLSAAEAELAIGDSQAVISRLKPLHDIYPDNISLALALSSAYQRLNQPQASSNILQSLTTKEPEVLFQLARAYQMQGNKVQYHINHAEWLVLNGELHSAAAELDQTIKLTKDKHIQNKIEQRKQQILEKLEQLRKI